MAGTGYGVNGCSNIDRCTSHPCDDIALECVDHLPPLDGFTCICPNGTLVAGDEGNMCAGKNNYIATSYCNSIIAV